MRTIATLFVLMLVAAGTFADSNEGRWLHKAWVSYQINGNVGSGDALDQGVFVGFVIGVSHNLECIQIVNKEQATRFLDLVLYGTSQQVQAAVKKGANLKARDERKATPLMRAAQNNPNPEVMAALLAAGADVNAKAEDGQTALYAAAQNNPNVEVVTALLKAGADVNAKVQNEMTALMFAANRERRALWGIMCMTSPEGRTDLMSAILVGRVRHGNGRCVAAG